MGSEVVLVNHWGGLLLWGGGMSRTIVYVDALNLYYRALRYTKHKWLNLETLAFLSLPSACNIIGINYYYAPVSGRTDPGAPRRQGVYLRALKTLPLVSM
jgi:hypothetical protein